MKTMTTAALLILGLASCKINSTTEDKRWARLNGNSAILASGYEKLLHENAECPVLASAKGTQTPCKIKSGRLVDDKGLFLNTPSERVSLCATCVK